MGYFNRELVEQALQQIRDGNETEAQASLNEFLETLDRCLKKVRKGEPIFVLRAQDMTSVEMVQYWLDLNTPSSDGEGALTNEHKDESLQCVDEIQTWQAQHTDLVKMPD